MTGPLATGPSAKGPLVSIVLPVYNGRRYLRDSIDSCLRQTYENWELIVVDDASSDETPAIIAEFAASDDRIRTIRHDKNRKLPAALNTGFADSRGEYLTWTSDDNLYEPEAIALMVESLRSHSEVGLVYCNMHEIGADGEYLLLRRLPPPEAFPEKGWIGACFMYRREVYEAVGDYDPDFFLVEDFEYWIRVHHRFKMFHRTDIAPYKYRRHENALTETRQVRIRLQAARAVCRHTLTGVERKQQLIKAFCDAAWRARRVGDYSSAFRYYLESVFDAGVSLAAIVGLLKLAPHRLLKGSSPRQPAGTRPTAEQHN